MNAKNLAKIYIIETKIVSPSSVATVMKGGRKAVENFFNLLKTHVEKMSTFRLSTMLMKTKELSILSTMLMKRKGVIGSGAQNSGFGEMPSPGPEPRFMAPQGARRCRLHPPQ